MKVHSKNWNGLHESVFQKVFRTTWEILLFGMVAQKEDPLRIFFISWSPTDCAKWSDFMPEIWCNRKKFGLYRFHVQARRFMMVKIDFAYDYTLKIFFLIEMISYALIYIFLEFFMFFPPVAKMVQRKKCWNHVKTVYLAIWNRLNEINCCGLFYNCRMGSIWSTTQS